MAKSWVKLTKPGPVFGLAYFVDDVVELDADKYKEVMAGGGCVPAEAAEIEVAKAAIAKADAAEAAAKAALGPSNADLLLEISRLREQLAKK